MGSIDPSQGGHVGEMNCTLDRAMRRAEGVLQDGTRGRLHGGRDEEKEEEAMKRRVYKLGLCLIGRQAWWTTMGLFGQVWLPF